LSRVRVIAGILFTLSSICAFSQERNTLTVQGTISTAGTAELLPGAQITLTGTTSPGSFPQAVGPVLSDSTGRFAFRNLEAGSYRLTVMKNGYVRQDTSITLANSTSANNLTIRMTPTATISGHIRDSAGRPAAKVPVKLLRRAYSQEGLRLQESFSTESNDLGEYRIYGIVPGRYYIAAGTTDSSGFSRRMERYSFDQQLLDGENGVQMDYSQVFYPGVTDMTKASLLDVQAGSHRSDVDITVTRQRLFSARGRVTLSTTGLPPPHLNWSGASGDTNYDAKTGRFELTGLVPDDYTFGIGWESLGALVKFVVNQSDIDGLAVTLEPSVAIHGRIDVEGMPLTEAQFDRINVRLTRSERGNEPAAYADVNADGTFTFDDEPVGGDFRVTVSGLPSGFYVKAARLGGSDALNGFAHATRAGDLELLISSRSGQVRGVVTGNNLQPLAGAQVALIPDKPRYRTELFKTTMTTPDGRFTFAGIAPGDYKLFAWDGLERMAFFDPEILAQFEERGMPLRFLEASEQTVELKAIPAGNVQ
jgi:hypothetical protein